ncbi:hypothetical protein [Ohtaekwangia koreensis]|uniref:Trypsin-like peptidase domain-containing protein n=1 Tax=Ohtaekwangia koreensis TaxID=688867 RepID=A0A1T5K606_9BACT|nr:hypothetical protein [Ohtaekwangia koreensis]SKC59156.1 hypothetical protein SAMN05660236_1855 [Ohtaekwangia koreensis]
MKSICFLILFSILGFNSYPQKKYSVDDLSKMVVCIADQSGQNSTPLGTATIISDSLKYYLVTALHVSSALKHHPFLIFKTDEDIAVSVPLNQFVRGDIIWTNHKEADISIIEITPYNEDSRKRLKEWSFPLSNVLATKEAVPREINVTIIGYPIALFSQIGRNFSAFTFRSFFASELLVMRRADTGSKSVFQLLENPSMQGLSGGPVLVGIDQVGYTFGPNQTILVGIVHGTYSDNTGGKLAMITPAYYIREILK